MAATTILFFNGLHFPAEAIDRAIRWSSLSNSSLLALFAVKNKDLRDEYPFPNDLAETGDSDFNEEAKSEDHRIIADAMSLVKRDASLAKIDIQTRILTNPDKIELHAFFEKADRIFLTDKDNEALLAIKTDKISSALEGITAQVERVP